MRRVLWLLALICVLGPGGQTAQAASPIPTVLGRGPELHLFPSFGPVGTHVTVVGLGYAAGTRVRIAYGPPNAEFTGQTLAIGTVGVRGRFYTGFTVSRKLLLGHVMQPLVVAGLQIGNVGANGSAVTAFIATAA